MSDWREQGIEADTDAVEKKLREDIAQANKLFPKPMFGAVVVGFAAMVFVTPIAGMVAGGGLAALVVGRQAQRLRRIKRESDRSMQKVVRRAADRLTTGQASEDPIE